MAGVFVDIKLEILIVQKEASSVLENGYVIVVPLSKHVIVVSLSQSCFHLDNLSLKLGSAHGIRVAVLALWKGKPEKPH